MRRTQQAVSTVLPSVGITYGFRKVASRVSPSGKSLTAPERHPREIAVGTTARNRGKQEIATTGTANTIAANPLKRIPSFMKNPRREIVASVDRSNDRFRGHIWTPSAARNSKRNKAARGSARGVTRARQRHP